MAGSVVVGGSHGIGRAVAEYLVKQGDDVIVTSRSRSRADDVAASLGEATRGLALDLSEPATIEEALTAVESVDRLVITAIEQGVNSLAEFDLRLASRAVTVKLVGYTEVVRVLRDRFQPTACVVLFGGIAKDRPYPGSTMVTAFNGGVEGLVRTLAVELAPHRINAIHPGVVGDSPKWREVSDHPAIPRTPIGRLVTMAEVVNATAFLLDNTGINGHNLVIDGGFLVT